MGGASSNVYRFCTNNVKQWNSSVNTVLSLKQNNGMIFSCGIGKIVDIFNKSDRLCSLTIWFLYVYLSNNCEYIKLITN